MTSCFPVQNFLWDQHEDFAALVSRLCLEYLYKAKKSQGLTIFVPNKEIIKQLKTDMKKNADQVGKLVKNLFYTPACKELNKQIRSKSNKYLDDPKNIKGIKLLKEFKKEGETPVCVFSVDQLVQDSELSDKVKGSAEISRSKINWVKTTLSEVRNIYIETLLNPKNEYGYNKMLQYLISMYSALKQYNKPINGEYTLYDLGLCIYGPYYSPLGNIVNLIYYVCDDNFLSGWYNGAYPKNIALSKSLLLQIEEIEQDMYNLGVTTGALVFTNPQSAISYIRQYKIGLLGQKISPMTYINKIKDLYKKMYNNNRVLNNNQAFYPDFIFGQNGCFDWDIKAHIDTIYYMTAQMNIQHNKIVGSNISLFVDDLFKNLQSGQSFFDIGIKSFENNPIPNRQKFADVILIPLKLFEGLFSLPLTIKIAKILIENPIIIGAGESCMGSAMELIENEFEKHNRHIAGSSVHIGADEDSDDNYEYNGSINDDLFGGFEEEFDFIDDEDDL